MTNWQGTQGSNWVATFSGRRMDLSNPCAGQVHAADIARALGNQCRFTGHVRQFYSVAEHCIHVSRVVPPEFALAALLHDAQEAYIADMSTPMKAEVGGVYREIEKRVVAAIDEAFHMDGQLIDLPQCIIDADRMLLMTERDALFDTYEPWGKGFDDAPRYAGFNHWFPTPQSAIASYSRELACLLMERHV